MINRFLIKEIYKIIIFIGIVLAIVINLNTTLDVLGNFFAVLNPVILGIIMAFILSILVDMWEKLFVKLKLKSIEKFKRGISILLSFFTIFVFLYLIFMLIAPQLKESLTVFSESFPSTFDSIKTKIINYLSTLPSIDTKIISQNLDGQEIVQKLLSYISSWTGGIFDFLGSFFGLVANIVMGLIIAIYIVATKEKLKVQFDKLFNRFLSNAIISKMYYVFRISNDTFRAFVVGQFTEAVILGLLCALGLWIFRFPYPPMIGSVIGFTSLLPIIGAYIGGLFGFIMILTQSPIKAVLFIVFLLVLQQIEGNIIYPRVVGNSVGLPGLWVMISIVVGGGLFGITGILFGLPLLATVYKILKDSVKQNKKLEIKETLK